ncbi:MAG: hypothetical protein KBA26_12870, partial [Candidatus Delongbacteria bacterium]|nr:hypothetical protein [Candidatus Delongbacteria bacterium]
AIQAINPKSSRRLVIMENLGIKWVGCLIHHHLYNIWFQLKRQEKIMNYLRKINILKNLY